MSLSLLLPLPVLIVIQDYNSQQSLLFDTLIQCSHKLYEPVVMLNNSRVC